MSLTCIRRLKKEYSDILANPPDLIKAIPLETNILEWHYMIEGPKDSLYEGGFYHGKIMFPREYPFEPPGIIMLTPSGRFEVNVKICLSMSDYHPESWNPLWSVKSILLGLLSFMLENTITAGSITTTDEAKRKCASESMQYNLKDSLFRSLFSDFVDHYEASKTSEINNNSLLAESSQLIDELPS